MISLPTLLSQRKLCQSIPVYFGLADISFKRLLDGMEQACCRMNSTCSNSRKSQSIWTDVRADDGGHIDN